jgi:hypothetical protein
MPDLTEEESNKKNTFFKKQKKKNPIIGIDPIITVEEDRNEQFLDTRRNEIQQMRNEEMIDLDY